MVFSSKSLHLLNTLAKIFNNNNNIMLGIGFKISMGGEGGSLKNRNKMAMSL